MAIDTRDKRASILGLDLEARRVYPNPDGAIAGDDRQHIAGKYRGISALVSTLMALERTIVRRVFGRIFGRVN
ncbi:MAG TPA: hypothetical protein VNP04_21545 [Alphaproteobacteria bacterium]|nr:hypothetical protein [Alphaproteobacteria bacterium]